MGYGGWPPIGWHHAFVIGWSKYGFGLPGTPLLYGITWPVWIPTIFKTPMAIPLQCLSLGLCKGTVKSLPFPIIMPTLIFLLDTIFTFDMSHSSLLIPAKYESDWNDPIDISTKTKWGINDLVQDCSISSVLAMEILQSFIKPLTYPS